MNKKLRQWKVRLIPSLIFSVSMLLVYLSAVHEVISLDDNAGAFAWFMYLVVVTCTQAMVITYYVKGFDKLPSWWEVAELMSSWALLQFLVLVVGVSVLNEEFPQMDYVIFLLLFWLLPTLIIGWIGAGLRGSLKGERQVPHDLIPNEPDLLDEYMLPNAKGNDE